MTSTVSTHVLDTAAGRPADGVWVRLEAATEQGWDLLGEGVTDEDGRVAELGPDALGAGVHRLTFGTGGYFARDGRESFFPEVSVTFEIADPDQHYHVPILLAPFAFSTYRGS